MATFCCLEWLTRHYLEKAELTGDWRSYLQAHGLANYCVVVDPKEERCRLVYDIEESWYKGEHPLTFTQHQQLTGEHKQLLKAYRDDTRLKFGELKVDAKSLDEEKLFDEQNLKRLENFASKVTEASKACSEGLANVCKNIISSSVGILKQAGRDAPCRFAVLGLGSIAKGEATPYSDLEYAFLVERDDEYFTYLAMDSYFRLGNLGESPLKTFDIEELESEGEELPLATAHLMKAGLRIDGVTKNSGNIPTGNGKDNSQSLTRTVDGFMELYRTSAESPFDGMPGDKSDMLSSTVVFYTNEGTNPQLHSDFLRQRNHYEENVCKKARVNKVVNKKRFESFKTDLNTYAFLPEFVDFKPPANLNVKVKTDIFRYPTLLANNIKMCLGLDTRYSWDVFNRLKSKRMLSADNHRYIQAVLALSIYMRTSAYLHQGCQTEVVMINLDVTEHARRFYPLDLNLFVILGRIMTPLKRHIAGITKVTKLELSPKQARKHGKQNGSSSNNKLHSVIPQTLGTLHFSKDDSLTLVEVLYFVGSYSQAKTLLRDIVGGPLEFKHVERFLRRKLRDRQTRRNGHTDKRTKEKYLELCGYVLYYTGDYGIAGEYLQHLVHNRKTNIMLLKLCIAVCKQKTGDYQSARRFLDEAKDMTEDVREEVRNAGSGTNHPDAADHCNSIGNLYYGLGDYKSALEYYTKSVNMRKAVYGAETDHPDIACSYINIGCAYHCRGEYRSALEWHEKSLVMTRTIHGAEANHPDIAGCYRNIGSAYSGLDDCESLEYYDKSLEMMKALYGAEGKHPDIAGSYNNIGIAYSGLRKYTSALKNFNKSLKMRKALYHNKPNHPDIAANYNNIGIAYSGLGEYTSALEYLTESLKMRKAAYGAVADHPDILTSYQTTGQLYHKLRDYKLSQSHLTKAVIMYHRLYGPDHPKMDKFGRF